MKNDKLIVLSGCFVGMLILSNIIAVKLIQVGYIVVPAAVIAYAITFVLTDVIGEVYGKEEAKKTVWAGLITQVLSIILIQLALVLPPAEFWQGQESFSAILSQSTRIVLASLIAYMTSQSLDVMIFHKLKAIHGNKKLWIRENVSTMISQLVDTTLFITIAFYNTVPLAVLVSMIFSQYMVKFVIAILDTPFAYLLVRWARK